jgi:hypothetical protein
MTDYVDKEVNKMGLKKHGVGDLTEVEKTFVAKTADKDADFTEDDEQALARENAEADKEA